MITPGPPHYASVDVRRQLSGGRDFLLQAKAVGMSVLGNDSRYVTSITEYGVDASMGEDDEWQPPVSRVNPISPPRLEICEEDELAIYLGYVGTSPELETRSNLSQLNARLDADQVKDYEKVYVKARRKKLRARVTREGFRDELSAISEKYELEHCETPLVCSSVKVIDEPGRDHIVGLFPDPDTFAAIALEEQAEAFQRAVGEANVSMRYVTTMDQVAAPFGRFPGNVTPGEYNRLMDGLQALTPVYTIMGKPAIQAISRR